MEVAQRVARARDLRPTTAAMSPAPISSISSRLLACIWSSRPIRSLRPVVALISCWLLYEESVAAHARHAGSTRTSPRVSDAADYR